MLCFITRYYVAPCINFIFKLNLNIYQFKQQKLFEIYMFTFSCITLKNGQTYLKNIEVFTPQYFKTYFMLAFSLEHITYI